ncbi:hypothetical protein [Pseudoxanthomonas sp. X-1]|uniref:hypothetical protein n=1 Tax=Pseudoxanthomonas sp. X-1 TaxID=2571115 RepID=UPI001CC5EF3E|nr:hypothetical protein [Pseudoxanthomonas sp. X-1]
MAGRGAGSSAAGAAAVCGRGAGAAAGVEGRARGLLARGARGRGRRVGGLPLLGGLLGQALGLAGLGLGGGLGLGHLVAALLGQQLLAGVGGRRQARQGRRVGIGLADQGLQAPGFVEVLAADALLGGDHRVGHEVGQCAGHRRIVGLLVAQGQVVLHRVVAGRRVQAVLADRARGCRAQVVGAHGLHARGDRGLGRGIGGHGLGRALRIGGRRRAGRGRG